VSNDRGNRGPEVLRWCGYLPHPIFLVFDFANPDVDVPQPAAHAAVSTPSCVCVNALASVDGDVSISLSNSAAPKEPAFASQVFSGLIAVPFGRVAVVTSENQKLLELPVPGVHAFIRILVDDPHFPSTAWVEAKPA
jgi:hypothetical protein